MKFNLTCAKCSIDYDEPQAKALYSTELPEDGVIKLLCEEGHETLICTVQQRFEVLAELAAGAIVDGYYREAIASFKASLERFNEFFIEVVCIKRNIQPETFSRSWGMVRRQSERQLGAFLFVYLLETGNKPPALPNHLEQLRNDVTHNGKLPSRAEAMEFGQAVIDVMAAPLGYLNARRFAKAVQSVRARNFRAIRNRVAKEPEVRALLVETAIRLADGEAQASLELTVETLSRVGRTPNSVPVIS